MPTPAYLIAQQVIPKVKAQCPRIMQVAPGKNSFTFFAGSPCEQTVQFRKMMARANPFWEPSDHEPAVLHWRTRVNATWLSNTYDKILLDEIYAVMGVAAGTRRYDLKDDLPEITGRAMQIAKARIWGIPHSLRAEGWFFHRILTSCAKKTVPEAVWKLACVNAGNIYGVNECVLMDAILEQKSYQSLYAIHPLLGRSWVPWIRGFVEQGCRLQGIGERADHSRYARQLRSELNAHGIGKSGMKTLHRMAESSPMTFRSAMRHLINAVDAGVEADELGAVLNLLNGHKPAPGVRFREVIHQVTVRREIPARHPEDIRVLVQIDHWLAKDMRFDRGLIHDWMVFMTRERRGSLHRGYLDVTKDMKSPAKRKEAALAWANRSQQYWHRHRPRPAANIYQMERRSLRWKPIIENSVTEMNADDQRWQFVELTTSEALQEEGRAMRHCVAGYDGDCHRGKSHIFSVRDAKGQRISTLELRPKFAGAIYGKTHKYVIAQNRGVENTAVSAACKKSAEQFLKMLTELSKLAATDHKRSVRN